MYVEENVKKLIDESGDIICDDLLCKKWRNIDGTLDFICLMCVLCVVTCTLNLLSIYILGQRDENLF